MKIIINRVFQTILTVLALSLIVTIDCRADVHKNDQDEFEKLYNDWNNEAQEIRFSSRTDDYLKLPSFQKIVDLGQKTLPFLKEKLETNDSDFMLAHAVIKIKGWKSEDFGNYFNEQELCKRVLKRMELSK